MNETIWERGLKEGLKEGLEKGRAEQRILERQAVARELLEEQFGSLNPKTEARLMHLTLPELIKLGKAILHAESLRDLGLE